MKSFDDFGARPHFLFRNKIKNKGKYWDDLFFKMSNDINGVKLIGIMAWVGVRCFGWIPWNDYRDEEGM